MLIVPTMIKTKVPVMSEDDGDDIMHRLMMKPPGMQHKTFVAKRALIRKQLSV